jgi:hypothetical protein
MELQLPFLSETPTTLVSTDRTTRGDKARQPDTLPNVLSLGEPIVLPVTEDLAGEDEALRKFITESSELWSFSLVYLGCSFRQPEQGDLESAWLTVTLDGRPEKPIVWSMAPLRVAHEAEQTRSVTIGGKLALGEFSVEHSRTAPKTEISCQAFGLQETACIWEFSRGDDDIRGSVRLVLVARCGRGTAGTGAVSMQATVRRQRLGVFPYRAEVAGQPAVSFVLPA